MNEIKRAIPIHYDIRTFPLLASLSSGELGYLRTLTVGVHFLQGEIIIKEGEQNHHLYLLKKGLLNVERNYEGNLYALTYITQGQMFGEASFLYGIPASATVTAAENCDVYQIHSHEMHAILDGNEQFKRSVIQIAEHRLAASALAVNHVFQSLPVAAREIILYNARFVRLRENELLYRDGDSTNHFMCIILSGQAEVSINHPDDPACRVLLNEITAGDEIGEIALVTEESHTANVRAVTALRLLLINTESILAFCDRYPSFSVSLDECIEQKMNERQRIIDQLKH
jgi:CRP-like cAMP-binding protein